MSYTIGSLKKIITLTGMKLFGLDRISVCFTGNKHQTCKIPKNNRADRYFEFKGHVNVCDK